MNSDTLSNKTLRDYESVGIGFVSPAYGHALKHTYPLTIQDVLALGKSINNPITDLIHQFDLESDFLIGLSWREYNADELHEIFRLVGFDVPHHHYCHYSDCLDPVTWRPALVSAMHQAFPVPLTCKVIVGCKRENVACAG